MAKAPPRCAFRIFGRFVLPGALLLTGAALGACYRPYLNRPDPVVDLSRDSVVAELILIGDAGVPAPDGEPVLRALKREIEKDVENTTVVFLGDNLYPQGLVADSAEAERREGERILDAQMEPLLETRARGIFVPGNHDWAAGGVEGWNAVRRQVEYINRRGRDGQVRMLPEGGCPGPEVVDFGEVLRLIVIDTEWWLHPQPKPGPSNSSCRPSTQAGVIDSLRATLASAGTRRAVIAAHHPMVTGGQHGGYFDWPSYLFPVHPWARQAGVFARQDVTGVEYRRLIQAMGQALGGNPPMLYAAGHEHNLQVLRRGPGRFHVVSGGGVYGHTMPVRAITGARYVSRSSGFMRLTALRDGRVRLAVILVDAQGNTRVDFSAWIESARLPQYALPDSAAPPAPSP